MSRSHLINSAHREPGDAAAMDGRRTEQTIVPHKASRLALEEESSNGVRCCQLAEDPCLPHQDCTAAEHERRVAYMMRIEQVTLQGRLVRLESLRMSHAAELYEASRDPALWTYKPVKQPQSLAGMRQLIASTLQSQEAGACLPFAIRNLARGCAVGETRYHSFTLHDRGVEIGWTWLAPSVQRTGVNTECKYLLLRHAFEEWGAIRVQFRTHHLNTNSQRAIERLGAVREGVLRNHLIMPDGSYRHSVYFSIIDSEWPAVKARLEEMMQR